MRIVERKECGAAWDAFCDAHPGAWWWWRSEWLNYQVARGGREFSFGVMDGDQLVAICPLFLEGLAFTMEGHPGPGMLALAEGSSQQKISMVVFDQVESLARDRFLTKVTHRWSPFSPLKTVGGAGWSDVSWRTQIIDLEQSEAGLHAGLRKSYAALVNKALRTYHVEADDLGASLASFQRLHAERSGRETRPLETWLMQEEWCRRGNGLVVAAWDSADMVAASYWIVHKGAAYYASASSRARDGAAHACVWTAMLALKARGVRRLELGWIDYPPSEVGTRGLFKTGFGGRAVIVPAVERKFVKDG